MDVTKNLNENMSIKTKGMVEVSDTSFFQYEVTYEMDGKKLTYNIYSEFDLISAGLSDEELALYITSKIAEKPEEKDVVILNENNDNDDDSKTKYMTTLQGLNAGKHNYVLEPNGYDLIDEATRIVQNLWNDLDRSQILIYPINVNNIGGGSLPAKYSYIVEDASNLIKDINNNMHLFEEGYKLAITISAIILRNEKLEEWGPEYYDLKKQVDQGLMTPGEAAYILRFGTEGSEKWDEFADGKEDLFFGVAGEKGKEVWDFYSGEYGRQQWEIITNTMDGKCTTLGYIDGMKSLDDFYFGLGQTADQVTIDMDNGKYDDYTTGFMQSSEMGAYGYDRGIITLDDGIAYLKDAEFANAVSNWSVNCVIAMYDGVDSPKFEDYFDTAAHAAIFENQIVCNNASAFEASFARDGAKTSGILYDGENGAEAIGNTNWIMYVIGRGHGKDWLSDRLDTTYDIIQEANKHSTWQEMGEMVVLQEDINHYNLLRYRGMPLPAGVVYHEDSGIYTFSPELKEYYETGTLGYNMQVVDGKIYQRVYDETGMLMLTLMDTNGGMDVNPDGKPAYTIFTDAGYAAMIGRNFENFANQELGLTDAQIEIIKANVDNPAQLLDKNYIMENKDALLQQTGLDWNVFEGLVNAVEIYGADNAMGAVVTASTVTGLLELGVGLFKFGENLADAILTAAASDVSIEYGEAHAQATQQKSNPIFSGFSSNSDSFIDWSSVGTAIGNMIRDWCNKDKDSLYGVNQNYENMKNTMWNNLVNNPELYNIRYDEFMNSSAGKNADNEYFTTVCARYIYYNGNKILDHYEYHGDDGKVYKVNNISDIPPNVMNRMRTNTAYITHMNSSFEDHMLNSWSLDDSSSSSQVTAALMYGVRTGDFSTFNGLGDNILKNAAIQFDVKDFVKIDHVGDWAEKSLYDAAWYKIFEEVSLIRHDNILGQAINQVGNMAIPLAANFIPIIGPTISGALLFGSAFGGASEEAFQSGAGYNQALGYATLSATTELLIEKIFSGFGGFGVGSLDDVLHFLPDKIFDATGLDKKLGAQVIKELMLKGVGEGIEEITTDLITPLWQSWTYMNDKTWSEIVGENVTLESLANTFMVSFLSSMIFGGLDIGQQTNSFNKISNELLNFVKNSGNDLNIDMTEVEAVFGEKMKDILAQYIGGVVSDSDISTNVNLINKLITDASLEIAQNPDAADTLNKLQQALKQILESPVNIKAGNETINLTREELMQIEDIIGIDLKYTIKDGNIVFEEYTIKGEDGKDIKVTDEKAFYEAMYEFVTEQYASINGDIQTVIKQLKDAQKDLNVKEASTAVGVLLFEGLKNGKYTLEQIKESNKITIDVKGQTFTIPSVILEKLSTKVKIMEDGTLKFTKGMTAEQLLNTLYERAIKIKNDELNKNNYDVDKMDPAKENNKGQNNLVHNVIDIIKPQKNNQVIITDSTKVDGKDLTKLEIQTNINGKNEIVNVYVENTTDTDVYKDKAVLDKIKDVVTENKGKENVYLGEITVDKETGEVVTKQNEGNKSYVDSIDVIVATGTAAASSTLATGLNPTANTKNNGKVQNNTKVDSKNRKDTVVEEVNETSKGPARLTIPQLKAQMESYIESLKKEFNQFIETHKNDPDFNTKLENFKTEKTNEFSIKLLEANGSISTSYSERIHSMNLNIEQASDESVRKNLITQRDALIKEMNNEITDFAQSIRGKFNEVINSFVANTTTNTSNLSVVIPNHNSGVVLGNVASSNPMDAPASVRVDANNGVIISDGVQISRDFAIGILNFAHNNNLQILNAILTENGLYGINKYNVKEVFKELYESLDTNIQESLKSNYDLINDIINRDKVIIGNKLVIDGNIDGAFPYFYLEKYFNMSTFEKANPTIKQRIIDSLSKYVELMRTEANRLGYGENSFIIEDTILKAMKGEKYLYWDRYSIPPSFGGINSKFIHSILQSPQKLLEYDANTRQKVIEATKEYINYLKSQNPLNLTEDIKALIEKDTKVSESLETFINSTPADISVNIEADSKLKMQFTASENNGSTFGTMQGVVREILKKHNVTEVINQIFGKNASQSEFLEMLSKQQMPDAYFDRILDNYIANPSERAHFNELIEQIRTNCGTDMSKFDALRTLYLFETMEAGVNGASNGICNYATAVDFIADIFEGQEALFKEKFGYDLHVDGDITKPVNYARILVDLYSSVNNGTLITRNTVTGRYEIATNNSNYLNLFNTQTGTMRVDLINKFLSSKGVDLHMESTNLHNSLTGIQHYENVLKSISENIKAGKHVSLTAAGFQLFDMNGQEVIRDCGSHIMTVVGVTSDGKLIVNSWGKQHIYDLKAEMMINGENFTSRGEGSANTRYTIISTQEMQEGAVLETSTVVANERTEVIDVSTKSSNIENINEGINSDANLSQTIISTIEVNGMSIETRVVTELIEDSSKLVEYLNNNTPMDVSNMKDAIIEYIDYMKENNLELNVSDTVMKYYDAIKYAKTNNLHILNETNIIENGTDAFIITDGLYRTCEWNGLYKGTLDLFAKGMESLEVIEENINGTLFGYGMTDFFDLLIKGIDQKTLDSSQFKSVVEIVSKINFNDTTNNGLVVYNVHDVVFNNALPIYLTNKVNGIDTIKLIEYITEGKVLDKNYTVSELREAIAKLNSEVRASNLKLSDALMEKLDVIENANSNGKIVLNINEFIKGKSPLIINADITLDDGSKIKTESLYDVLKMENKSYITALNNGYDGLNKDNLSEATEKLFEMSPELKQQLESNYEKLNNSYVYDDGTLFPKEFLGFESAFIKDILDNPNKLDAYKGKEKANIIKAINEFVEYGKNNAKQFGLKYDKVLEFINKEVPKIDKTITIKSKAYDMFKRNQKNGGTFGTNQGAIRDIFNKIGLTDKLNSLMGKQISSKDIINKIIFGKQKADTELLKNLQNAKISEEELRNLLRKSQKGLLATIEQQELNSYLNRIQEIYPGMSTKDAINVLYLIETNEAGGTGICNYASMVNLIFEHYLNNPAKFESDLGYPMYVIVNGKEQLNTTMLLVDLFASINKGQLVTETNGVYNIAISNSEYLNLTTGDGKIAIEHLNRFLNEKNITIDYEIKFEYDSFSEALMHYEEVIIKVNEAIKRGDKIHISSGGFNLYYPNGKLSSKNVGSHIMSVLGITKDGNLIVDSWGQELILNLKEAMANSGNKYTTRSGETTTAYVQIVTYDVKSIDIKTETKTIESATSHNQNQSYLSQKSDLEAFDVANGTDIEMIDESKDKPTNTNISNETRQNINAKILNFVSNPTLSDVSTIENMLDTSTLSEDRKIRLKEMINEIKQGNTILNGMDYVYFNEQAIIVPTKVLEFYELNNPNQGISIEKLYEYAPVLKANLFKIKELMESDIPTRFGNYKMKEIVESLKVFKDALNEASVNSELVDSKLLKAIEIIEDKTLTEIEVMDKLSILNVEANLPKGYDDFIQIYNSQNIKSLNKAIKAMEQKGYTNVEIAKILTSYAFSKNNNMTMYMMEQKTLRYLTKNGMTKSSAIDVIRMEVWRTNNLRGTRLLGVTESGVEIRVVNNSSKLKFTEEDIKNIMLRAEKIYAKTDLKQIIINDINSPDDVYYSNNKEYSKVIPFFTSAASASSDTINLWRPIDRIASIVHEYGHTVDRFLGKNNGSIYFSDKGEYTDAIKKDKKITPFAITDYAKTNNHEDFAEFIKSFEQRPVDIGLLYPNRYMALHNAGVNVKVDTDVIAKYVKTHPTYAIFVQISRILSQDGKISTSKLINDFKNGIPIDTHGNILVEDILNELSKKYPNRSDIIEEDITETEITDQTKTFSEVELQQLRENASNLYTSITSDFKLDKVLNSKDISIDILREIKRQIQAQELKASNKSQTKFIKIIDELLTGSKLVNTESYVYGNNVEPIFISKTVFETFTNRSNITISDLYKFISEDKIYDLYGNESMNNIKLSLELLVEIAAENKFSNKLIEEAKFILKTINESTSQEKANNKLSIEHFKFQARSGYTEFKALYESNISLAEIINQLKEKGFTPKSIVEIMLTHASLSTDASISKDMYYKAFEYYTKEGNSQLQASRDIKKIYQELIDKRGTRVVAVTSSGVNIRVVNNCKDPFALAKVDIIIEKINELEKIFGKSKLKDVYIYDTFSPANINYEVEQYKDYNNKSKLQRFEAQASATDVRIDLWSNFSDMDAIAHEYGHTLDFGVLGSFKSPFTKNGIWESAIKSDGNSVSKYGNSKPMEDFAEFIKYFYTNPVEAALKYPNRYNVLSESLKLNISEDKIIEFINNNSLKEIYLLINMSNKNKASVFRKLILNEQVSLNESNIIDKIFSELLKMYPNRTELLNNFDTDTILDFIHEEIIVDDLKFITALKEYIDYRENKGNGSEIIELLGNDKLEILNNLELNDIKDYYEILHETIMEDNVEESTISKSSDALSQNDILSEKDMPVKDTKPTKDQIALVQKKYGTYAFSKFVEIVNDNSKVYKIISDNNVELAKKISAIITELYPNYTDSLRLTNVKMILDSIEGNTLLNVSDVIRGYTSKLIKIPTEIYTKYKSDIDALIELIQDNNKFEKFINSPNMEYLKVLREGLFKEKLFDTNIFPELNYIKALSENKRPQIPETVSNEFNLKNPNKKVTIETLYDFITDKNAVYKLLSNESFNKIDIKEIKESLELFVSIGKEAGYSDLVIKETTEILNVLRTKISTEGAYDLISSIHREYNTYDGYYEFESLYEDKSFKETLIELENRGYTSYDISRILLEKASRCDTLDDSKAYYYKAFDYLVNKGVNEKNASMIIFKEYNKILLERGTRVVATTKSGVKIKVVNNLNNRNPVLKIDNISKMMNLAENYYKKTGLKEIVIYDTFSPKNLYSEKVQYEDYVKKHNRRFISSASANENHISIWADFDDITALVHEYGHTIDRHLGKALKLNGAFSGSTEWINAMYLDKKINKEAITEYATASLGEDFAEFLREFHKNPIKMATKYPNRYKVLSKYLSLEIDPKIIDTYISTAFLGDIIETAAFIYDQNNPLRFIKKYLFGEEIDTKGNTLLEKALIELETTYEDRFEILYDLGIEAVFDYMQIETGISKQNFLEMIEGYLNGENIEFYFYDKRNLEIIKSFDTESIREYMDESYINYEVNIKHNNNAYETEDILIKSEVSINDIPREFRGIWSTNIIDILEGKVEINPHNYYQTKKAIISFIRYLKENNITIPVNQHASNIIKNLRSGSLKHNILNFSDVLNGAMPIYGPYTISVNNVAFNVDDIMMYLENRNGEINAILNNPDAKHIAANLMHAIEALGRKSNVILKYYKKNINLIDKIKNGVVYNYSGKIYIFPENFNGISTEYLLNITNHKNITQYLNSLSSKEKISYKAALNKFAIYVTRNNIPITSNLYTQIERVFEILDTPIFRTQEIIKARLYDIFENSYINEGAFGSNQGKIRYIIEELGINEVVQNIFGSKIERKEFLRTLKDMKISEKEFVDALIQKTNQNVMKGIFTSGDINLNLYKSLIEQVKINYPGMTTIEAVRFLYLVETVEAGINDHPHGICNNPILVNMIFDKYIGKEKEFQRDFGYPMYIKSNTGKKVLNDARLLVDIYSTLNDGVLVTKSNGKYNIQTSNKEYVKVYGVDIKEDAIKKFIEKRGINLSIEKAYSFNSEKDLTHYDYLMFKLKEELNKGNHIVFSGRGFDLYPYEDTEVITDCGGHAITVVGINEYGDLIVDSWGLKYSINLRKELTRISEIFRNRKGFNEYRTFTISTYSVK